ncbi:AsmA-like C-terminal region-containing protein [Rhizobium sp. SG2393]|uniref:AsmA family protein n=1 Tax=Rhizobium sp. SG2393 TaxID=3276279 RepID=UPI0036719F5F
MQRTTPAVFLARLRMAARKLSALLLSARLWLVRRVTIGVIGLVLLLALSTRLVFPLLVGPEDLASAFTAAIVGASGATLTVKGETDLSLWPSPVLRLSDVTLTSHGEGDSAGPVTIAASAVQVGFDVAGVLFGHPDYENLRLTNATITLSTERASRAGEGLLRVIRAESGSPVLSGTAVFEGARLRVLGADAKPGLAIDDVWGTVVLPGTGSTMSGDLTGMLHGVATTLSFRSNDAAGLLTGHSAPLSFGLTSTPASLAFDGVGMLSAQPFVSGALSVTAPSVGGLARLVGAQELARNPLGPVAIEARLSTAGDDLKFDNVDLTLGDTSGRGVLDLGLPTGQMPKLSGTLAFDRIDLSTVLPVIGGLQVERAFLGAAIADQVSARIRTDLRLSADDVHFASLTASRVAAGLRGSPGRLSLDIGDATVAGGRLSGSILVAAPPGEATRGSVDIHLRDAEMETLATALAIGGPVSRGRAAISLSLQSPEPILIAPPASVTGTLTVTTGAGSIRGLDPQRLSEMMEAGTVFSLASATSGTFPFETIDIDARIAGGRLRVEHGGLTGSAGTLNLRGVIDLPTSGLALAGRYDPLAVPASASGASAAPAETVPLTSGARFFVGGNWPQAVVTPLSVLSPER